MRSLWFVSCTLLVSLVTLLDCDLVSSAWFSTSLDDLLFKLLLSLVLAAWYSARSFSTSSGKIRTIVLSNFDRDLPSSFKSIALVTLVLQSERYKTKVSSTNLICSVMQSPPSQKHASALHDSSQIPLAKRPAQKSWYISWHFGSSSMQSNPSNRWRSVSQSRSHTPSRNDFAQNDGGRRLAQVAANKTQW